jgi:hypothetical protein
LEILSSFQAIKGQQMPKEHPEISTVLVTGTAGFIGYHLANRLLADGYEVIGVDIVNDYYDITLKNDRLSQLNQYDNFQFNKTDLADKQGLRSHIYANLNRRCRQSGRPGWRPLLPGEPAGLRQLEPRRLCQHLGVLPSLQH